MNKSLIGFAILLLLLTTGCATKYCHPYKGAQELERDKYDCNMKTRSGSSETLRVDLGLWFDCMKIEKGLYKCSE